jgi:hypothetical protein
MVQTKRLELLDRLRDDVMVQLKKELTDKTKYKKLMKELIVQVLYP